MVNSILSILPVAFYNDKKKGVMINSPKIKIFVAATAFTNVSYLILKC